MVRCNILFKKINTRLSIYGPLTWEMCQAKLTFIYILQSVVIKSPIYISPIFDGILS